MAQTESDEDEESEPTPEPELEGPPNLEKIKVELRSKQVAHDEVHCLPLCTI